MSRRLDLFLALPMTKLEKLALEGQVRAIGLTADTFPPAVRRATTCPNPS